LFNLAASRGLEVGAASVSECMLYCIHSNLPDPVLEEQSAGRDAVPGFISKRSAVFVSLPEINYGTRYELVMLMMIRQY
jgi:hypothetical protein